VLMYVFDLLELDGQDMRREPLETRKATLASLLRGCEARPRLVEHLEQSRDVVYRHACKLRTHASGDNARTLADAGLDRMLLHVRDPRQVTISCVHMMQRITTQEFIYASHMYDPPIPETYRRWTFISRQLRITFRGNCIG
jgi:hypothetical protein